MSSQNQRGFTLLEVLLSIVILTLILVSVMSFFPQMGLINNENGKKALAVNLAKKELIEWQEPIKGYQYKSFLSNPSKDIIPEYVNDDIDYYYFEKNSNDLIVEIQIKKTSDIQTNPSKAHFLHIKVKNKKNSVVSETFGYVIYD